MREVVSAELGLVAVCRVSEFDSRRFHQMTEMDASPAKTGELPMGLDVSGVRHPVAPCTRVLPAPDAASAQPEGQQANEGEPALGRWQPW